MPKSWSPLESNPDVVTSFAKKLGLDESLSYIDIYSTEDWALDMIPKPVYAVYHDCHHHCYHHRHHYQHHTGIVTIPS